MLDRLKRYPMKLLGWLGAFTGSMIAGSVGWWLGALVGNTTAWIVGGVAGAVGVYYGRKWAFRMLDL
ncbi:MAG: hypothetical protein ACHQXA_09760 [Gemmatimonadales bacterium]